MTATIITGGTRGIGLAIATRLAGPGATLVLGYHGDDQAAEAAKASLEGLGAKVQTVKSDIGSIAGCAAIVERAVELHGGVRHLIHNAAVIYPTTLLAADLARFGQAMETNGTSLLYLAAAAVPHMQRGGAIVFITSAGAKQAQTAYGALGCGKALAESIMRYLVPELAPLGIRINAVGPGFTDTDSVAGMVGGRDAAVKLLDRMAARNPSGRAGRDSDYTSLVEFLLSPEAEFIQGQTIQANGGVFV